MYYLYKVSEDRQRLHFVRQEEVKLFGCNVGMIPKWLRDQVPAGQAEPWMWHISVEQVLRGQGQAVVIDLKPNSKDKTSLSLYQLRDVWGYSSSGWTPGMLRLRGLCVDGEPRIDDPVDFVIKPHEDHDSIFTFLHFEGSVHAGRLTGRWTAPPRSSTNSALLWPEALSYLVDQIRETAPGALSSRPELKTS